MERVELVRKASYGVGVKLQVTKERLAQLQLTRKEISSRKDVSMLKSVVVVTYFRTPKFAAQLLAV